jgi:hypothetical protein
LQPGTPWPSSGTAPTRGRLSQAQSTKWERLCCLQGQATKPYQIDSKIVRGEDCAPPHMHHRCGLRKQLGSAKSHAWHFDTWPDYRACVCPHASTGRSLKAAAKAMSSEHITRANSSRAAASTLAQAARHIACAGPYPTLQTSIRQALLPEHFTYQGCSHELQTACRQEQLHRHHAHSVPLTLAHIHTATTHCHTATQNQGAPIAHAHRQHTRGLVAQLSRLRGLFPMLAARSTQHSEGWPSSQNGPRSPTFLRTQPGVNTIWLCVCCTPTGHQHRCRPILHCSRHSMTCWHRHSTLGAAAAHALA